MNDQVMIQPQAKESAAWKRGCARLMKKCWMPLAILVITVAVLFSIFRALTPWATQYKGDVERHLSLLIGQPVIINSMETSWYWFEPVLKLNQVTVLDNNDHVLKLAKLLVGINLFSSLLNWHIQPGILYVDDVHLSLHQINDRWQIDGLRQDQEATTLDSAAYLPILNWLLGQQKIIIKNVSALVHLKDGSLLPLSGLNLTAINRNGHYRLKGEATLAQTMSTALLILADMQVNPSALNKISGHAYLSVHHFLPKQWQVFFPQTDYRLEGGKGNFEIWLDVLNGQLANLQTRLDFRRIEWKKPSHPHSQFIQSIRANLAWSSTLDGWQLSGDQIKLRADGLRWPENSLMIQYHQPLQTYHLFLKKLLLEPLLNKEIQWPEIMQPVLAVHPRGQLDDLQVEIKDRAINYVLSRFTDLGWQARKYIPGVSHLSGVVSWQPTEGRLELDGENTTLDVPGLRPVTFTDANAAFEWKELSAGLRVSMERLVLSHPDLVLSARGALDQPFSAENRNLRLSAEFSASEAQQWLAYVPSQILKPKLNNWLKQDIKRIDKVSGQLVINGNLIDFPFEQQPGAFTITSRLSGIDLSFHKKWPSVRNLDLYLNVNKRTMDLEVLHASLLGIEATQANLRMDDIGLGKESLLLHGKINTPITDLKSYVLATPLSNHLSKLNKLDVTGPVDLELNLEVPLYPENDDVLVRGALGLENNKATFHHALNDVQFTHLTGVLKFNEHGVTDSDLKARLLGDPVAMHIKSMLEPKPYTSIAIVGDTTIELLREKFNLPLFSLMHGHLKLTSQLNLTDSPNDLDNMQFGTSLKGVSIDLPAPFGKSAEEKAPLTIKADFNDEKAIRLRFNYDQRISSDLWFRSKKGNFVIDKGQILVGSGTIPLQKQSGLQLFGMLSTLDVSAWQEVWSQLPNHDISSSFFNKMQLVDMKFGDIAIWGKNYSKVAFKANKLSKDIWSVQLEQQDIAGDLQYNYTDHTLSGRFKRLYTTKPSLSGEQTNSPMTTNLKPADIPNLNVIVDALKLGKVEVGSVVLKSTSSATNFHLDSCVIKSPEYQLFVNGDWSLHQGKNLTTLQADLKINHLADSLKRWEITPIVDAHQGNIQFKGSWPGTITDFSLAKTNGDMYIGFQDGVINNLSRETEEKLGLGKLLSILSLQTIPRRLKLDFSDLSNTGYSFDVFKGNFAIKNGVMNTKDSYIDGPVAYASMKGNLDVVRQLYDIELHVSPHITASLPIVATIAGGPIAGMAAWVASKIINQGMQRVTGYTYKVSGPWLSPVVQQVSIYKHQMNKR